MTTGLALEQAADLLARSVTPLGTCRGNPSLLLGRTLARDVAALYDQPPFSRSPLDGYALQAADTAGAAPERPVTLPVVDHLYAGDAARVPLGPGQAVRIMTGAMLPAGCDCVLRQEDTDQGEDIVRIYAALSPGDNLIRQGEDYRAGSLLLPAGTRLDAAAIGVLAGAGIDEVTVYRRPRVAVLATGDELVSPDTRPLPPGKIYGSNLALLLARLGELGLETVSGGQVGDDPALAAERMSSLLEECDLLITTGGVSVGQRDILHQVLPLMGAERLFWKVRLKPGGPAMFSLWQGKPILSLSGNPFAAAATFELLARPLLAALAQEPQLCPSRQAAVLDTPFPKASRGRRFVRGRFEGGHVTLPQGHASGMLRSLVGCNCLVDIPAGSEPLVPGQSVQVVLL